MADVLSQSEVESLLAALDPGAPSGAASSGGRGADALSARISVYDFKRPERVSKDQMHAFQVLHEGFSREFGAGLSGMLRSIIEVKLISVDQLTYSEFVFSLENPTCFNLIDSKGLEGNLILDLNPSIIFPIVDRLLGGGKDASHEYPNRALTEIELRLVSRITDLAIKGLENAWANICPLGLHVSQVESNPQLIQIVPPNEVVVLVSFEIIMGEIRGIMNLCIPFNTIEPLASKLSSDTWSTYTKRGADARQRMNLDTVMSRAAVEMTVTLARTALTTHELRNLCIGDIIMTEKDKSDGLEVMIEGRPLFLGAPGVLKGRKAIRIGKQVARLRDVVEERLKSHQPGGGEIG